jgi:hypothetical protein
MNNYIDLVPFKLKLKILSPRKGRRVTKRAKLGRIIKAKVI